MSWDLGSVPAGVIRTLAASTNIPASAGALLEIVNNLGSEARVWEVFNGTGKDINIYQGPDTSPTLVMTIPGLTSGMVKSDRAPITFSKGTRLAVRAADNAAITSGNLIINLWR